MSASNPYRPPDAYVADVATPDAFAGAYVDSGHGVPAGHGWTWIANAYELFKKRIGGWILTSIVLFALIVGFMVVEVIAGFVSDSLAVLADAGHMLSDAASLGLALGAVWLASRPATLQRRFGYRRAEILEPVPLN